MIEIDDLRKKLETHNLSKVAELAGVDKHTLYRLMHERSRPAYDTVKRLVEWMEREGIK